MARINIALKLARINRNLKQIDLARELGVSENLVSAWETSRSIPLLDMRYRISKVLGSTPEELFNKSY